MAVPTDPDFYSATDAMAGRIGAKGEDLLWLWASESGYDPTIGKPVPSLKDPNVLVPGLYHTISTLNHGVVDSGLLTQAEWDSLPTLSATQQLPFIERLFSLIHKQYLGSRAFKGMFETYLANAAPGLLRTDGSYNPQSTMYGDPNQPAHTNAWEVNWPMDNYPVASDQATARGVPLTLAFGHTLVSEGLLKGWITLGDLQSFALRPSVGVMANPAILNLRSVRAGAGLAGTGVTVASTAVDQSPYVPDMSALNPTAPIDTRVAPSRPTFRPVLTVPEFAVLALVTYFAVRWFGK
jgi:hypothetical protein